MDVSEVASSGSGTIHGMIVGQVSPVKSTLDVKYFERQISDGVKTMQLVLLHVLHKTLSNVARLLYGTVELSESFQDHQTPDYVNEY